MFGHALAPPISFIINGMLCRLTQGFFPAHHDARNQWLCYAVYLPIAVRVKYPFSAIVSGVPSQFALKEGQVVPSGRLVVRPQSDMVGRVR